MTAVTNQIAGEWTFSIDGSPPREDLAGRIVLAVVETHLLLPSSCTVRLEDTSASLADPVASGGPFPFRLGSTLEVTVTGLREGASPEKLFEGEVVAIEGEFLVPYSYVTVRAYDKSHRFHTGRKTRTFTQVSESDVYRQIAGDASVSVGTIDGSLNSIRHLHLTQANLSDWEFLRGRVTALGMEAAVIGGRLEVRKKSTAPPVEVDLGAALKEFRPRVSAAQQVGEVKVLSWDPKQKQQIVGTARVTSSDEAELDGTMVQVPLVLGALNGSSATYVRTADPVTSQGEAGAAAEGIARDLTSTYAEAWGLSEGDTRIQAGGKVKVTGAGDLFDGTYSVTTARHTRDRHGYNTEFEATGRSDRSLLGLTSWAESGSEPAGRRMHGPVIGVVTNVKDERGESAGVSVKVKFPWLDDSLESAWARLAAPGAGKERGMLWVPEVNDEVLVLFELGDFRRPIVVGGLWNGKDTPPLAPSEYVPSSGIDRRTMKTRIGSHLTFVDESGKEALTLEVGKDGKWLFRIDKSSGRKVEIISGGDLEITAEQNIKITAKTGDISLEAGTGGVNVKGMTTSLEGQTKTDVKGAQVGIQASGPATIKGNPLGLN